MRWIQHVAGKVTRGSGSPPLQGDYFIIDEKGAAVIKGGILHIDGKQAIKSTRKFAMDDGSAVEFDVPGKGQQAKRTDTKVEKGGVVLA